MSGNVAPAVQFRKVIQTGLVRGVGSHQIEVKAEALEIRFQVLEIRVAVIELSVRGELGLHQNLKRRANSADDDLSALRVKIAAKSLKVCAQ